MKFRDYLVIHPTSKGYILNEMSLGQILIDEFSHISTEDLKNKKFKLSGKTKEKIEKTMMSALKYMDYFKKDIEKQYDLITVYNAMVEDSKVAQKIDLKYHDRILAILDAINDQVKVLL